MVIGIMAPVFLHRITPCLCAPKERGSTRGSNDWMENCSMLMFDLTNCFIYTLLVSDYRIIFLAVGGPSTVPTTATTEQPETTNF